MLRIDKVYQSIGFLFLILKLENEKVMEYRNFWKGWTGGDRIDRSNIDGSQVSILGIKCLDPTHRRLYYKVEILGGFFS